MGRLERILIAANRGAAMHDVRHVAAVAGRGLRGDRYYLGRGTFSGRPGVFAGAREISIIDKRAIERCNQRLGTALDAAAFRRNLVISGLDFAELAHCDLIIGAVRLRVKSGCPPCHYLSRLIGVDARAGLRRIGGIRAAVIQNGTLRPGMRVTTVSGAAGLP